MVLFIGDRPSPRMKPGAKPFEGAACEVRLRSWISRLWLIPGYTCQIVNSTDNDAALAVHKAILGGWAIVALGNNASRYLKAYRHFKLPHPSGLNRLINDKTFIASELEKCRLYIWDNR